MAAALPAIGAMASVVGSAASAAEASANKPSANVLADGRKDVQLPMSNTGSYLNIPGGSGGNGGVPSLGSYRDYSLMHILQGLGNGQGQGD